jgi:hypothetical protein
MFGLDPWLVAAGATLILAVLALKLRGPLGRTDLTGPRKPNPMRLSRDELDRLTALVGGGGEEEALRQLKDAGYEEPAARRLIWLMAKIAETDPEGRAEG